MDVWHENYPKEVPPSVDVENYSSISELIVKNVAKFGDKPAFSNMGISMTYAEMDRLSDSFANYLTQKCGLKKGDRIALQMPNILQFPVAMYGAIKAGIICVNTNPVYTEREMLHQFKDSGAKAILILANFACHLEKIIEQTEIEHVIITELGDLFPGLKKFVTNTAVKHVKKMVPNYNLPQAKSFSRVVCGRGCSSNSTLSICACLFLGGISIGRISSV